MQQLPSPFNRWLFSQKSSIIDVQLSLSTPQINYHSVLTLKSMLSFKFLSFNFSLKETLTLLTMFVKQYTAKRKTISEDIITNTVKRTCRNTNRFNFHQFLIFTNDNIEYLQVLVVQKRFCHFKTDTDYLHEKSDERGKKPIYIKYSKLHSSWQ